jgi:hypothetical protein
MTAKEKLRDIVEELSEPEAAATLDCIVSRRQSEGGVPTQFSEPMPANRKPAAPDARRRDGWSHSSASIAAAPAWLFVGVFASIYVAMMIVIIVLIVRALT